MKGIHVAVGAIVDGQGRILTTKRPDHSHQGGLWEFPGGKLEPGETPLHGLTRELEEELGIRVLSSRPLIRVYHNYPDRKVVLDVHLVDAFAGEPHGREGQPLAWTHPEMMDPLAFPAADRPIITALRLPTLYLITGDDPLDPDAFLSRLARSLDAGIRLAQLRAHEVDDAAYAHLAEHATRLCEARGARLLLNRDPSLVHDLPCHGLHLSARRLAALDYRPFEGERLVGASCHCPEDLARATQLGLDYALLSPVRATATHPGARTLGWARFAAIVDRASLPVYALGGLNPGDLEQAFRHGAQGVAAIRGLWQAGPSDNWDRKN